MNKKKKQNKLEKYFKTKPKISLTTLIIILLFVKYVTPTMILFITPLTMGTLTPDVSYEKTEEIYNNMAETLAESFSDIMMNMYKVGQGLSKYSLLIRVFFYGVIWTTYVAIVILVLYMCRMLIYYLITTKKERRKS